MDGEVTRRDIADRLGISVGHLTNYRHQLPEPVRVGGGGAYYYRWGDIVQADKEGRLGPRRIDDDGNTIYGAANAIPPGTINAAEFAAMRGISVAALQRRVRIGTEPKPDGVGNGRTQYWKLDTIPAPPADGRKKRRWQDVVPKAIGGRVWSRHQIADMLGWHVDSVRHADQEGRIDGGKTIVVSNQAYRYWDEDGIKALHARINRETNTNG